MTVSIGKLPETDAEWLELMHSELEGELAESWMETESRIQGTTKVSPLVTLSEFAGNFV
ncbi:TPA: hypothetical protein PXO57_004056 [Yersinia enterocolitica]|uniref:hypothetical protein n=1 Tax=Yersinia enterocolitica TaxID=630 RepID=UPI0005DF5B22|nr:hypothetical protein [Yersinia enterocolitica]UYJ82691.1 hypothetical protein N4219_09520 [Yersinia enterocolitica]CFB71215.1 Uncharacterised protein [Yersinia enterocolitica]CNI85461.1 Uncharacterised protein [Yersinia enterocolitica]CQD57722.1 Uncharacterised protein [Yersinia enterocolitica]HDL6593852.1 hypothetical protein [Yersinia enterocolitica]